jgi:hypothetical protein
MRVNEQCTLQQIISGRPTLLLTASMRIHILRDMDHNFDESDAVELSQKALELMNAVAEWKSAECVECRELFTSKAEAIEHQSVSGHSVIHHFVDKAVN